MQQAFGDSGEEYPTVVRKTVQALDSGVSATEGEAPATRSVETYSRVPARNNFPESILARNFEIGADV